MKWIILLILSTSFFYYGSSQPVSNNPVLFKKLRSVRSDSSRVCIWLDLAFNYTSIDSDSALLFTDSALGLVRNNPNQWLEARTYNRRGIIFHEKGKWSDAISSMEKALAIRKENHWPSEIGRSLIDIGNVYYTEADSWDNDSARNAGFQRAIDYYQKASGYFVSNNDEYQQGVACYCKARAFFQMAMDNQALENYRLASAFYTKSGNSRDLMDCYTGIARVYNVINKSDSARYYYKLAANLGTADQDLRRQIHNLINLADQKNTKNDSQAALTFLLRADSLAGQLKDLNLQTNIKEELYHQHLALGDTAKAIIYLTDYAALKETRFTLQSKKDIEELNAKYETERLKTEAVRHKLDLAVAERNKESIIVISGVIVFTVLIVILLLIWRQRFQRLMAKKDKELMTQRINQLMKDQEIRSMETALEVRHAERERISKDLHDKLGGTLSVIGMAFESISEDQDNPKVESAQRLLNKALNQVSEIAHDMFSGVLNKFGLEPALNDLRSTIEEVTDLSIEIECSSLDQRLNTELELNLYRIIQELITNALKHAHASHINITLERLENLVILKVSDNGIGFNIVDYSPGMGLKNMKSRVAKFNGACSINSIPNTGTEVTISINTNQ